MYFAHTLYKENIETDADLKVLRIWRIKYFTMSHILGEGENY